MTAIRGFSKKQIPIMLILMGVTSAVVGVGYESARPSAETTQKIWAEHNRVLAKTVEIPDRGGALRINISSVRQGNECVQFIQYYGLTHHLIYGITAFEDAPRNTETLPCSRSN